MTALDKAIEIAGSAKNLSSMLGISRMAISLWKNDGKGIVPAHRVLPIHQATGVTPHELRPDLYPNPSDGLSQQAED